MSADLASSEEQVCCIIIASFFYLFYLSIIKLDFSQSSQYLLTFEDENNFSSFQSSSNTTYFSNKNDSASYSSIQPKGLSLRGSTQDFHSVTDWWRKVMNLNQSSNLIATTATNARIMQYGRLL